MQAERLPIRMQSDAAGSAAGWRRSGVAFAMLSVFRWLMSVDARSVAQPTRVWVVMCDRPSGYLDPPYPTDPEAYGLREVLGVWADAAYAGKVKVFTSRDDAVCSTGHAHGALVVVSVFDRIGGQWRLNEVETNRFSAPSA